MPDRRTRATGGRRARSGPLDPQRVTRVAATVLERDGLDRFTLAAVAEELGVTSANLEQMLASPNPDVRRLLGVDPVLGTALKLDPRWAYNAIKAIGNYGELFDRTIGPKTPIGLDRGLNRLWTNGGLMYAWPMR